MTLYQLSLDETIILQRNAIGKGSPTSGLLNKEWRLDTGDWTLETGHWRLDTGDWTLETGHWRLETGHWRLDTVTDQTNITLPSPHKCLNDYTLPVCSLNVKVEHKRAWRGTK